MTTSVYESVIGLEIHAQLITTSKLFCFAPVQTEEPPNSLVGVVSAGLPGALPVLNKESVIKAIKAGIALNCRIPERSVFERKNYFYPDLPKGYQISQLNAPIGVDGHVDIYGKSFGERRVGIDRIQIEEDAGKLSHVGAETWVDLNRAGTSLIEIVSRPEIRSPEQAAAYMKAVYNILTFAGVCDGNLELGNFRCDANVSVRKHGEKKLGTRTEIKNVNSFRFVEKAIDFEIARQIALVESGAKVVQETRGWDAGTSKTYSMRLKEDAQDYRYFPDPDLPPLVLSETFVSSLKAELPKLPHQIVEELKTKHGLDAYFAQVIGADSDAFNVFEDLVAGGVESVFCAKWVCGDLAKELNDNKLGYLQIPFSMKPHLELLNLFSSGEISAPIVKKVLRQMFKEPGIDPRKYVEENNLAQVSDEGKITEWLNELLGEEPLAVEKYKKGEEKVFDFLVGKVMAKSRGRANPSVVKKLLKVVLG